MLVLVFAGFHSQYKEFIHREKLNPREWIYVNRPEQLMGHRKAKYITVGQYWLNPVWDKAQDLFKVYEMERINCLSHHIPTNQIEGGKP